MIIPEGFGQFNVEFEGTGVPTGAEVTIGFFIGPSIDTPTEAATQMIAAIATSTIMGNFSATVNIRAVNAKFGPNDDGPQAEVPTSQPGTNAGAQATPGVAVLCQKVTGFGGRTGRGRWYWPAPPEGSVDQAGLLTAGYASALQVDFDALHVAMINNDLNPYLLHGASAPLVLPRLITSFQVSPMVATQRRRQRR